MRRLPLLLLPLTALAAGCPVTQPQNTPVDPVTLHEPRTGAAYKLYVPEDYSRDRTWPLVITLHGTHIWDGYRRQMMEWKALAEAKGFLVVAPSLRSPQGILPVIRDVWYKDLRRDEKAVLAIMDQLISRYRIDPDRVLLTGFSAGGYPMYWIGLRNPERFDMLIARACNADLEMFERIELTGRARKLPVYIYCGKDDLKPLRDQAWLAYRYLKQHGHQDVERKFVAGGHLRRPELAWSIWSSRPGVDTSDR